MVDVLITAFLGVIPSSPKYNDMQLWPYESDWLLEAGRAGGTEDKEDER